MSDTLIIGIAGLARSGKDTIADHLQRMLGSQLDRSFGRYSFATPMKDMLKVGLDLEDKDDAGAENLLGCNYRRLAQTIGTEWGRDLIHPNIWVILAEQRCKGKYIIVSDVRFDNEAEWIRQNGLLIHVDRHDQKFIGESFHKSENGVHILHRDFMILNNGSLDKLKETCKLATNHILDMVAHKKHWGLDEVPDPTAY